MQIRMLPHGNAGGCGGGTGGDILVMDLDHHKMEVTQPCLVKLSCYHNWNKWWWRWKFNVSPFPFAGGSGGGGYYVGGGGGPGTSDKMVHIILLVLLINMVTMVVLDPRRLDMFMVALVVVLGQLVEINFLVQTHQTLITIVPVMPWVVME